jgi:signal transduction histidine kinase
MVNKNRRKPNASIQGKLLAISVIGLVVPILVLISSMLYSLNIVTQQSKDVATSNLYTNIKTNVQYETNIALNR